MAENPQPLTATTINAIQPVGRISDSVIRRYDAKVADYAFG
jgi:hypothetical protein